MPRAGRPPNWPRLSALPLLFLLAILALSKFAPIHVDGFNIDTRHALVHRRPNTGFGYALDFAYRDQRRSKYR